MIHISEVYKNLNLKDFAPIVSPNPSISDNHGWEPTEVITMPHVLHLGGCQFTICAVATENGVQIVTVKPDGGVDVLPVLLDHPSYAIAMGEFISGSSQIVTLDSSGKRLVLINSETGEITIPEGQDALPPRDMFQAWDSFKTVTTKTGTLLYVIRPMERISCFTFEQLNGKTFLKLLWGVDSFKNTAETERITSIAVSTKVDATTGTQQMFAITQRMQMGHALNAEVRQIDPVAGKVIKSDLIFMVRGEVTLFNPYKRDTATQYITGTITSIEPLKLDVETFTNDSNVSNAVIISRYNLGLDVKDSAGTKQKMSVEVQVIQFPDGSRDMSIVAEFATAVALDIPESKAVEMNGNKGIFTVDGNKIIYSFVRPSGKTETRVLRIGELKNGTAFFVPMEQIPTVKIKGDDAALVIIKKYDGELQTYVSQVYAVRVKDEDSVDWLPITQELTDEVKGLQVVAFNESKSVLHVFTTDNTQRSHILNFHLSHTQPVDESGKKSSSVYLPLVVR